MLGAIIGDVVGSIYEFDNTKNYHFKMFTADSNYTDDTVLTVAVADWAMGDASCSQARLEEKLLQYGNKYPNPVGGYGEAFNSWLFYPEYLIDYRTGKPFGKRCPYNSWGNGSAMRVSSIGWLFDTLEETERVAGISAAITHNHPEGIKGAQATAAAIFMARNGAKKEDIRIYVEKRFGYDLSDSWEHLHETYGWDSSCQGTVPQALIAFLESEDFESAVRMAVSMGGDSDTLACITGGVAEAYYQDIPAEMVDKVMALLPPDLLEVLDRLGEGTYAECYHKYVHRATSSREYTPDRITDLKENEIFVFGSNMAGFHAGGAARLAFDQFGAEWGVGVGMTGQCYAIPTMQGPIETIEPYVNDFIVYAKAHPQYKFYVTRIGCGIAGFTEEEIAPLFKDAVSVANIILPETFWPIITAL